MTYAEREEIFAKDTLDVTDMQKILGVSKPYAYQIMRKIKLKHDRLGIDGKIHVQDYLDYYKIPQPDRYGKKINEREMDKIVC